MTVSSIKNNLRKITNTSLVKIFLALLILQIITAVSCAKNKEYDYIIIGGGASGTIASVELAKKYPESSVLLLERGIDDTELAATHKLSAWPGILVDNDAHESIRYEDGVWTIVGNILAGGSALNAGIMGQESDEFFHQTFNFTADQLERVNQMYQKLYDELGHKVPQSELAQDFIKASEEMGLKNTGYHHGYLIRNSTFQTYSAFDVTKGTRNTTADYIRNAKTRGEVPNLTVQVRSLVNRLILSDENKVSAVSVIHKGQPEVYNVACSVLLAAGTIKSTQLLQVSGIGKREDIRNAGVPSIVDLSNVGSDFIDRIVESVAQFSPISKQLSLEPIPSLSVEDGLLEERTAGGEVTSTFGIAMGAFLPPQERSKSNMEAFKFLLQHTPNIKKCVDNSIQINVLVANPTSRGYIKVLTPNIADSPLIDPKFLDTEEDRLNSKRAQNKCHEYYTHESLHKWARTSDPQLECGAAFVFPVRMQSPRTSSLHIFGGVTYGKVLENDFSVKQVSNLYAIDGSIFPRATEINPFNTISAMGGFIANEFVKCPLEKPQINRRVKIRNVEDNSSCLAIGNPIYAEDCDGTAGLKKTNTLIWIQDVVTGRYTEEPLENTPYLLRSKQDDRYCMFHVIGGLTVHKLCNSNSLGQHVYFTPIPNETHIPRYIISFNTDFETRKCLMKWSYSWNISGFLCDYPEVKRFQWAIEVQEEEI